MAILTPTRSKVSSRVILGVAVMAAVAGAVVYFGVLPKVKIETREVARTFDLTDENQALDIFPASGQDFYVNYRNNLKNKAGEAMSAGLALDTSAYAESQAACLENQFFSDCQIKELPNDEAACAELANRHVQFTTSDLKSIEKVLLTAKTPAEMLTAQAKKIKYYNTLENSGLEKVRIYFDDYSQSALAQSDSGYQYSDTPSVYKVGAEILTQDRKPDIELMNKIRWRYMTTNSSVALAGPNGEIFPISIGETTMRAFACGKTVEVKVDTKTSEENKLKIRNYNQYGKVPADLLNGSMQSATVELPGKKEGEYIDKIELSPEIISGLSADNPQFSFEILASNDGGKTWVKEKNNKIIDANTALGNQNLIFKFTNKSADLKLAAIMRTNLSKSSYVSKDIWKLDFSQAPPAQSSANYEVFEGWFRRAEEYFSTNPQIQAPLTRDIKFSYSSYSTFYNSLPYWQEQNKGAKGFILVENEARRYFPFYEKIDKNLPVLFVLKNPPTIPSDQRLIMYTRQAKKLSNEEFQALIGGAYGGKCSYCNVFASYSPGYKKLSLWFLDKAAQDCANGNSANCFVAQNAETNTFLARDFGYDVFFGKFWVNPNVNTQGNVPLNALGALVLPQSSPVLSKLQIKTTLVKETIEKSEEPETSPLPEQPKDSQYPTETVKTEEPKEATEGLLQNPKITFRGEGRVIINWKSDQEKLTESPSFLFGASADNLNKKAIVYYDQKAKKFYAILWNLKEGNSYYFKLTTSNAFSDVQKFNAPTRFQNILYLYNTILGADLDLSKYVQADKTVRGGGPYYYWQSTLSYNEIKLSLLFDTQYREFDKRLAKSAVKQGTKKQIERLYRVIYDKIYPNNLAKIADEKLVNSYLKKVNRKDSKKITLTGVKFSLAKKFFEKNVLKSYEKNKRPAASAYFLVLHRQDAMGIEYLAKKYGKNNKAMRRELIEGKEFMSKLNMIEQKYGQEVAIEEIYEAFNAKPITAEKLAKFAAEKLIVQDIAKKILQGEWK